MKASMFTTLFVLSLATTLVPVVCPAAEPAAQVGVVSHVKVLSDKVPDVSSLEAWKKSFIKDGMCDQEKALAVWKSNVAFVYQDAPPTEFLHEGCVHDAIKEFNVYGYGMCCCASARTEQLSRYVGLQARGWAINAPQCAGGVLGQPLAPLGRLAGKLLHPPRRHDRQRRRHLPRRPGLAQGTSRLQRQQRQVDRVPPRGRLDRLEEGSCPAGRLQVLRLGRLVAGQDPRLVLDDAGIRRQPQDALPLRIRLFAGLPGQYPIAPRRTAHTELVQPGPACERNPARRRRARLSHGAE